MEIQKHRKIHFLIPRIPLELGLANAVRLDGKPKLFPVVLNIISG